MHSLGQQVYQFHVYLPFPEETLKGKNSLPRSKFLPVRVDTLWNFMFEKQTGSQDRDMKIISLYEKYGNHGGVLIGL